MIQPSCTEEGSSVVYTLCRWREGDGDSPDDKKHVHFYAQIFVMSSVHQYALLVCCFFGLSSSFPPNDIPTEPRTQSHNSITLDAIFQTTALFLDKFNLVNNTGQPSAEKVQSYFGTGNVYISYRLLLRVLVYHYVHLVQKSLHHNGIHFLKRIGMVKIIIVWRATGLTLMYFRNKKYSILYSRIVLLKNSI
jgi:hypothetical protein